MSTSQPAWRNAPLGAICLCASFLFLGACQSARADAPRTFPKFTVNMPPAPAGAATARSPRSRQAHANPHIAQFTGWNNLALATAADHTSYSVWYNYTSGMMAEWSYDAYGTAIAEGPTYGPYSDVNNTTWMPYDIGVNSSNDHAKILWERSDGAAGVWTMDPNGNALTVGPTFGPFTDWTAIGLATANDGSSNLLWQRSDGAMIEWALNPDGSELGQGPVYGPYTEGSNTWYPMAIGTDPTDYTARILWERSDKVVGFWVMDASATYVTGANATYGPYSDSGGAWDSIGIATANDGTSSVLWSRADGAAGVWSLDNSANVTNIGPTYGPYSDGSGTWGAEYEGIGMDPSDDTSRVLWNRSDGATGLWSFDTSQTAVNSGTVYGPYN